MDTKSILKISFLICILGIILFIPNLGLVHLFDWDEINFAEAAREMLVTGDYLLVRIDFEPFHEKPPFFIWLQAISMHIFGINEFGARFPNAVVGIISLLVIFNIGRKIFDYKFGLLWILAYIGSFLPHFYFKTAIIDPTFNLLIYLSLYKLYLLGTKKVISDKRVYDKSLFYAGLFTSIAVLTKGPVAFLLIILTWLIILYFNRGKIKFSTKEILLFTIYSSVLPILWYSVVLAQSGFGVINDFIAYHIRLLTTGDAGHSGPIYYHFVILLLGCFPASVFMLRSFRRQFDDTGQQSDFKLWNIVLLCVVLIVFSLVKTKIVHYSSLAYFPITFLAAYAIYSIVYRNLSWKLSTSIITLTLGIIFSILLILFPISLIKIEYVLPYVNDAFTYEVLSSDVEWGGYEYIIGIIYFLGLLASLILLLKKKYLQYYVTICCITTLTIFLFLPFVTPKIEQYTQNAPIEFFSYLATEDVYLHTLGYKSYVPFFYGQKKFERSKYYLGMTGKEYEKYLLEGKITTDAYFSVKSTAAEEFMKNYPDLLELYRKNGFVFLKREKVQ